MNQKTLTILAFSAFLLAGVYFFVGTDLQSNSKSKEEPKIFADFDGEAIRKIRLEQGAESLELAFKEGEWRIPARGDFSADGGKIRALLLKLFDLSASQKLPATEDSYQKLGLTDEALKSGKSRITLLDASEKPLASLRLGEGRKGKGDSGPLGGIFNGQYVRRDGRDQVYVIPSPVTFSVAVSAWIDAAIINILQPSIYSIVQAELSTAGEKVAFELKRASALSESESLPKLELTGGVPDGKSIQESVVTQVRSSLENVRISDVFSKDDSNVKELNFDQETTMRTTTGLVYSVQSAVKDDKSYIRITVSFDAELAHTLEEEAKKIEAAKTPVPTPSAEAAKPSKGENAKAGEEKKSSLNLSSTEQADKLQKQFAPWVYELPTYQAKKLRYTRTELLEAPTPPPAAAPPGQGGAPSDMVPSSIPIPGLGTEKG